MASYIFIQFNKIVDLTIVSNQVASLRHQLKTKTKDAYAVRVCALDANYKRTPVF